MGDYTELVFAATLKNDIPKYIMEQIQDYVNEIFNSGSCYFPVTRPHNELIYEEDIDKWTINIRCSVKDDGTTILSFIRFIKPYVKSGAGDNDFLGYTFMKMLKNQL
ncbi:hypothetical protein V7O66_00005 [Methanolobus sp. ZRKC3]|uniref:hypothetical protein n=1 Tax=Methanolobus sp. ZRKC3 TaxID=3125786 RepID=UPI00324568F1